MQAASILKPGVIEIQEIEQPLPGRGDIVIRVFASGICGTDVHIHKGEYLGSYPIVPGHEGAGVVAALGEGVDGFAIGDPVAFEPNISCGKCSHCLNNRQNFCEQWVGIGVTRPGCMAEYVLAPDTNVFSTDGLDPRIACFVEPLSCVLHGIQKANIQLADRVLIAGGGPIGLLLLQSAKNHGASKVDVVERIQSRQEAAEGFGAEEIFGDFDRIETDGYDVVIDATGSITVLERLINYVRYGGTMLFFGVAPQGETMRIEPFEVFKKGLSIVSSYTSLRNSLQAVSMLQSGRIRVEKLISHEFGLSDLGTGIDLIESGDPTAKKIIINPTV
jgi:D-arabinitol dehydrogenase (NADP+)